MPASTYSAELQSRSFSTENFEFTEVENDPLEDQFGEGTFDVVFNEVENARGNLSHNRYTTDLVRLYLSEIGRVPLLHRDEEVSEAQKVQRYIALQELRKQAQEEGDSAIADYADLSDVYDRLVTHHNYHLSNERWAAAAKLDVEQLKVRVNLGKQCWADRAGISVTELEQALKQGLRAKEHMIRANLRLVVSVAKKYQNRGLELLDLIQEGTLGLERAVEKFDPTKGYRFSTYAYWWIRQGITRAIASQSRTIRLPVHITEKLNKIKKVQRQLSQEKGRLASVEDIAKELDMSAAAIREVLLKVPRSVSLEIKVGKEQDTELGDLLETDSVSPEEAMARESLQQDIQALLAELTLREREVIRMRYGLIDGRSYSLAEIGRALDLSRERVRQIETKALHKLQQPRRRSRVRDYLEAFG